METSKNKVAKNWSLILGLSIPFLMVMFIALSIYAPRLFDNTPAPSINFIYTSAYTHPHRLEVRKNKLEWTKGESANDHQADAYETPPKIYLHDVKKNKSREIDLDEAKNLLLDSSALAPDGYRIEQSRHHGFFLFDYNYSRDRFLVKGHATHKLNLEFENSSYYNFRFLAWEIK